MAGITHRKKNTDASALFPRRDSIATAGDNFQQELHEKLVELRSIWDEVGMTEGQRRERMDMALDHLKTLLADMVKEEYEMRATLQDNLATWKKEVDALLKQLHQPLPDFLQEPEINTHTLLQLEEKYRGLKEELVKERDSRLQQRDALIKEFTKFGSRLGIGESGIDKVAVPEKAVLENLKRDVDKIKSEWEKNMARYAETRRNIMKMFETVQLDNASLTAFQRQIFSMADHFHNPNLVLSRENMAQLADLGNKMQEKYDAFLEEIHRRIDVAKTELVKWWDQCHVPQSERETFQTVDPEIDPELAVQQYNNAVQHWSQFYESRKTILEKVGEWENLWQEHINFEEREHDKNRYNNRGGALLQEEKRRKKIQSSLPHVYQQLSALVVEYNNAHPDSAFFMAGMPVMEYIDSIQREYQDRKRQEKEEKEMMKKQQLMTERLYGAKAVSPKPQKSRVGTSNDVTPSKGGLPNKKGLGIPKLYIHSSLANLRSPAVNAFAQAGPSSPKTAPMGLPIPGQVQKRKALAEQNEPNGSFQPRDVPASDERQSTASSLDSYGGFVKALRTRGVEVQSSIIDGKMQSP